MAVTSGYCSISIDRLPARRMLGSTIYDSEQTKLLTAGVGITDQLIDSLHRRKVDSVVVSQRDMGRIVAFQPQGKARSAVASRESVTTDYHNDVSRELDRDNERTGGGVLTPSENAFAKRLNPTPQAAYDHDFTNFLAEKREHHVDKLSTLNEACIRGDTSALSSIATIIGETLDSAIEDIDAFTCLGANPYSVPYPARHSLHSAMLATSVGAKLGLDETNLRELGIGCMIHDIGMLAIDRMTVGARKVLDAGRVRRDRQASVHHVRHPGSEPRRHSVGRPDGGLPDARAGRRQRLSARSHAGANPPLGARRRGDRRLHGAGVLRGRIAPACCRTSPWKKW